MEVSQDSQSIVFESSSQDPSNSGIMFSARRSSVDSMGTGSQAEGKQRGAQGTDLQSYYELLRCARSAFRVVVSS